MAGIAPLSGLALMVLEFGLPFDPLHPERIMEEDVRRYHGAPKQLYGVLRHLANNYVFIQ
jgi:hypothetical protein